ncbi:hypothetical protein SLEP1_g57307 [Rubroshorea leprosula]|uniref:Reverse transcriptase domain-containing protein n=1 Tax=Rubroshorea leprosula TaxID=152421 RepID=A0AAV5MNN2_9ROSI|nr:hypothetical protein SLEP1_g57307 [Rubroshorea leprosula]
MSVRKKLSFFEKLSPAVPASIEESDLLDRSIKKIKDTHSSENDGPELLMQDKHSAKEERSGAQKAVEQNPQESMMEEDVLPGASYRDKLIVVDNSSVISFATKPKYMEEDSDVDEDPEDDTPIVLLSKAEKRRIREPWMNAIIIKAFHHRSLGYNYVFPRVKAQWKPVGKWDFIDLGLDFFLVRFQDNEDLNKVIQGGPWFIGPYFLTMRRWELDFDPEEALRSTTTTAVWAQLPQLFADHYDPITLQKIGNKIGPLLRVDAHTEHHTRGRIGHRNNQCPNEKLRSPSINEATTSPLEAIMGTFKADCSQSKAVTVINPKPVLNTYTKMDPKVGQWIVKDQKIPNLHYHLLRNPSVLMELCPFLSEHPRTQVFLVKEQMAVRMETALEWILDCVSPRGSRWTMEKLFAAWRAPILTDMEVNLPEIVQRIPEPVEEPNQVDLLKILNLESPEEEKDGKNPPFHQSALVIDDAIGEGLRSLSASLSFSNGEVPNLAQPLPTAGNEPMVSPIGPGTTTPRRLDYEDHFMELPGCSKIQLPFSSQLIRERLDRAWANPDWKLIFPESAVFHLPRTHSDHCPILLDLNPIQSRHGSRPFRLEKFWVDHPEFQLLVQQIWSDYNSNTSNCLQQTMQKARVWSIAAFGNIFKEKKKLLDLWFMKSRANWLVDGDRNTKYFHCSTIKHKSRNRIYGLKNQHGEWVYDGNSIASIALEYFNTLFTTSQSYSYFDSYANIGCDAPHSFDLSSISGTPSEREVLDAINSMKPYKVPGPDEWSKCLLVLIPKVNSPESIQQFRPISLCNTASRIISKILVHRIKPWMDKIISPCQASFIPGRQGIDNVLILQEFVYSFNKKRGRIGDMVCKLDLEKAYDILEWSFIHETLIFFKFLPDIIRLIMSSITSASISVLINGDKTDSFTPTCGIRQGDPLSPYIFILCMEHLLIKITSEMDKGNWKGSKAGRRGPLFSHLFFADDIIFLGKATMTNGVLLKNILDFFCSRSGQKINVQKSKILFSKNVDQASRNSICSILRYNQTENLGKYLGIPVSAYKLNKRHCQFIVDKVRTKLAGWKTKFLSMAGHTTLAKSVLAAVPNYYMQTTYLPTSIHNELDRISRNFIWGADAEQKKIHLVCWDKVTQPKGAGGLGIKSAKEANIVAMTKLNWRLHKDKDKLWTTLFRNKYSFTDPHYSYSFSGSPTWKAIGKGHSLFCKGIKWIPRDGKNISFWKDYWVGNSPLFSILFGPHQSNYSSITVADYFHAGPDGPKLIGYQLPEEITISITSIPLSIYQSRDDTFAWKDSSKGKFSASSAYAICKNIPHEAVKKYNWIWRSPTIPKIQYFLWLLSHQRLKCFDLLFKLGINTTAMCPRCQHQHETIEHILRSCPLSQAILSNLLPDIFSPQQQMLNFVDWL